MNSLDKQYTDLLQDILDNGIKKKDRTGTGTLSVFGRQIRHKMREGFPLLTTKKVYFKGIVTELLWFLNGRTDLRYLLEHNNFIWVGDAYKKYMTTINEIIEDYKSGDMLGIQSHIENIFSDPNNLIPLSEKEFIDKIKSDDEFDKEFGDLGKIYGFQWRNWGGYTKEFQQTTSYGGSFGGPTHIEYGDIIKTQLPGIDQIANLIHDLKTNPDDRGIIVSSWNVCDLPDMTLRPCHNFFQFYTRELSLEEKNDLLNKKTNRDHKIENCFTEEEFERETLQDCKAFNIPSRSISLMFNMRSNDVPLGLPFNLASYGLLLEIIGKVVNMVPDELIVNIGDAHIYINQIDGVKEQIGRFLTDEERYNIWFNNNYETGMERHFDPDNLPDFGDCYYTPTPTRTRDPYPLPKLTFMKTGEFFESLGNDLSLISHLDTSDFVIENYQSHPTIKFPLSN